MEGQSGSTSKKTAHKGQKEANHEGATGVAEKGESGDGGGVVAVPRFARVVAAAGKESC